MTAAGTTSDLYMKDEAGEAQMLGAPPSAPAPVPQPTQPVRVTEPVVTKSRMSDETPDGRVRDTSGEALRGKGNDLGFRNLSDEELAKPKEEVPPPVEAKPAEVTPPAPPAEPKLYAGKFKTPEDLEKGYEEAQRAMHKAMEERAVLEREKVAQIAAPPQAVVKSPEQVEAEKADANKILTQFVQNPKEFLDKHYQEATQRTQVALATQELSHQWRQQNPDIAEHESYVAFEAANVIRTDPELAKDPTALLNKATANFRQLTGKFRTEGAKEALTQETRVIPLASSSTTPSATEQPAKQAPLTTDDAFALHLRMLKEQEQKSHRGLRR